MSSKDDFDAGLSATRGVIESPPVEAGSAIDGVASSAGVDPLDANAALARALSSHEIDAAAAQAALIDQVLAEQVGAQGVGVQQLERLRAEITALLANDPLLGRLLA